MGSLATCLKLHGFEKAESLILRRQIKEYRKEGHSADEARMRAVEDVLQTLNADRDGIIAKVMPMVEERIRTEQAEQVAKIQAEQAAAAAEGEQLPQEKEQKKTSRRSLAKNSTILSWLENEGHKINYRDEQLKGEIDLAIEGQPRLKKSVNKSGSGLGLDKLADMAMQHGYIDEATPESLVEALQENRMRKDRAEDSRDFGAEYEAWQERQRLLDNDPSEAIVEDWFMEGEDIPGGNVKEVAADGSLVTGGMREVIDSARAELEKITKLEKVYESIGLCIRQGG